MALPIIVFAIGGAAVGVAVAEFLKPKKGKPDEIISKNRSGERSNGGRDRSRPTTEKRGDGGVKPPTETKPQAEKGAENDSELHGENRGNNGSDAGGDLPSATSESVGDAGDDE